jgi:UDP-3-O-[3-hydroxymyristoyl] N-acetylglucosamine deacetylase
MNYSKEFTIRRALNFSGIGVHTGKISNITLYPSSPGSGIGFKRNGVNIAADIKYIENSPLCTRIINEGVAVGTVEHLLSALQGLGISNISIHVDEEELPILDGSSAGFVRKLIPELQEQSKDREFISLNRSVYLRKKDKFIIAIPDTGLSIDYFLDYPGTIAGFIYERFVFSPENFIKQISTARTFGFLEDAAYLRKQGLALGASNENTLVIEENGYSTELRFPNEPAKHKVLDLIGDLTFLGKSLKAKIIAYKTGHQEHFQLIKKILESL